MSGLLSKEKGKKDELWFGSGYDDDDEDENNNVGSGVVFDNDDEVDLFDVFMEGIYEEVRFFNLCFFWSLIYVYSNGFLFKIFYDYLFGF